MLGRNRSHTPLGAGLALSALLAACGTKPAPPPLILLISVDTLRADRLGAYGSERGLTPHLDALAEESLVYEAAYAPASFTVPSMTSVLTGRYPEQNAIFINESILPSSVPTMASVLQARGYRCGAVVSNWVLRAEATGIERGFERYDDRQPLAEAVRRLPERTAADTTRDALAMLDELAAEPGLSFLWVHYQDPHGPYTPPPAQLARHLARERATPEGQRTLPFGRDHRGLDGIPTYQRIGDTNDVGFYLASYDAEIEFVDQEIGRLLDGLGERGLMEDALIVFVADHGEGLGEDDYWFAHGEYLSDPLVRVPLFVRAPGREPGRRTSVVGLVDLLPTVLRLAGAPTPDQIVGRDLLAEGAQEEDSTICLASLGSSTVPRVGLVEDGYKYLAELSPEGGLRLEQLFRLDGEDEDLSKRELGRLAEMRQRLQRLRRELVSEGERQVQQLTPEELERMRALGYVGR
jgi:arylsulfatase